MVYLRPLSLVRASAANRSSLLALAECHLRFANKELGLLECLKECTLAVPAGPRVRVVLQCVLRLQLEVDLDSAWGVHSAASRDMIIVICLAEFANL